MSSILLTTLTILVLLSMGVGLIGQLLPIIPGNLIIFLTAFIYGLLTGFKEVNLWILIVLAILALFNQVVDYLSSLFGAKKFGATRLGIVGAMVGGIAGLIIGNLLGLFLFPILGAILFEFISGKKKFKDSLKVGVGTFLGFLGGTFVKLIIGIIMISIFLWAIIF